jgi:hypothetical protein
MIVPDVKAISGDEAAPTLERHAPHRGTHQGLCLGVDRGHSFEVCKGFGKVRNHTPPHEDEFTLSSLFVVADDRLVGCGSNVVIPRGKHEAIRQLAEMECFGNALFVGPSIVAATHTETLTDLHHNGTYGQGGERMVALCDLKTFPFWSSA